MKILTPRFTTPNGRVEPNSGVELEAQRQKTILLYRNAGVALTVNVVNASLVAYVNVGLGAGTMPALVWWCTVLAFAAGRYLLAYRFVACKPNATAAMRWRYRYVGATAMIALTWGTGTLFFMWNAPHLALLFTGLALCGMVAGAVPILAPVRAAFLTFALLIGVPMSAVIFLRADSTLDWAYGAMSVVFLLAVLASARYLHETLEQSIRLGLEQAGLLAKLERARRAAEAAVDASSLSLWDLDIAEDCIYLDENWAKIAGGRAGERVASTVDLIQAIEPESRERFALAARALLKGITPDFAEEIRIRTASGDWKWILSRGKVVARAPDGRATRAVGTSLDITQRKLDEEALAESEQRFRSMFDRNDVPMLLVDTGSGRIADANAAALRFYGYSRERLCNMAIQDVNAPNAETAASERPQVLPGTRNSVEYTQRLASGELRTVEVHSTPINVGDQTLLFAIVHDITARLHFERKLAEQSARSELLLQRASDGIHVMDRAGNIVEASDSFCALVGYSKPEVLTMNVADWDDQWSADELRNTIVPRLISMDTGNTFETRFRQQAGRILDVEVSTVGIDLAGQRLLYASARDVTERNRQLAAIKQAASVFENAHDGIIICDADKTIVDVNPAFSRVTGYSKAEAVGRRPHFLASGRHDAAFYRAMQEHLEAHDYWEGELWNRRKGGDLYVERLCIAAIRGGNDVVTQYIGVFSDITVVKMQHEKLELLAHHDALTGLPNRVLLSDRMEQAMASATRSGKLVAVCFLDLDGFKAINDRYGHEAGDAFLVEVARRLTAAARGEDTVARLGGDEFALLMVGFDSIGQAQRAIVRMMEAINPPIMLLDRILSITASMGATIFPDDSADPDTLLRHADQAMYLAKQAGKNCFKLFNPEHDRIARGHRESLSRVKCAIQDGEMQLHYQPKVDMRTAEVIGFEALVRWQHPEMGLKMPGDFLPILAGTDGELDLGQWVLRAAFGQMSTWSEAGYTYELSVNISAPHLLHPDFIPDLRQLLAEHSSVPANRIELEILETAALEDIERAGAIIRQCHALGLRVALDDFGTGHSSLSYIRLLPVDTVKIDRLFIHEVPHDPENVAVIECVLGLTRAFGRRIIAEGVESASEGSALVALGCDIGQGYAIGRPLPVEKVPEWLAQWQRSPIQWDVARLSPRPGMSCAEAPVPQEQA